MIIYSMIIIEYFYNDDNRTLYVEFSTKKDKDKYYRVIELVFEDIEYNSPTIITEDEMDEIDEEFIIDLLTQYFENNELPEEKTL
jgi:hypothetical protein